MHQDDDLSDVSSHSLGKDEKVGDILGRDFQNVFGVESMSHFQQEAYRQRQCAESCHSVLARLEHNGESLLGPQSR